MKVPKQVYIILAIILIFLFISSGEDEDMIMEYEILPLHRVVPDFYLLFSMVQIP